MYLAPDGQELEIAEAAAGFLNEQMPIERLRAAGSADLSSDLRKSIGELGWFALAVVEDKGGAGLSHVEFALFFRAVGRLCGPLDILAQSLAAIATKDAAQRIKILTGEIGVALILQDRSDYRVLGSKQANLGILATPTETNLIPIAQLDADIRPALDPVNTMRICADLPDTEERCAGPEIWQWGQLATSAMLIGIAETALELIVDYAKIRETFGRKIGSWQAVRHPCADMAVRLEAARAQLWFTAAAGKEERSDFPAHLNAAKHLANNAALLNADTSIQLHGGIGVTEEHSAHVLLKHALVLSRLFGSKRALLSHLLNAELTT
jgi:alkylation response protein AidB-like acyl-CoA dehydrogenase